MDAEDAAVEEGGEGEGNGHADATDSGEIALEEDEEVPDVIAAPPAADPTAHDEEDAAMEQ